jgi:3-oxoacyl-[acyl-carrier-protein] synthase II
VLGTTLGSFRSTSEYSQETIEQDKPYLVNPVLFPNTVMNRATGQVAIWYGLKGVNATVGGGPVAFFNALRYATNALRRGYADVMLAGSVEEFSAHAAWAHHLTVGERTGVPVGEGAAVMVIERPSGRRGADAEILSVTTGFRPAGLADELAACVGRALRRAGAAPEAVTLVVTADGEADEVTRIAVGRALGHRSVEHVAVTATFGQCQAASGALQAAAVLARHRADPGRDGQLALLTGYTSTGAVAAALLRGWSRDGAGRG